MSNDKEEADLLDTSLYLVKRCMTTTGKGFTTIVESIAWHEDEDWGFRPCYNCIAYGWQKDPPHPALPADYPGNGLGRCTDCVDHVNQSVDILKESIPWINLSQLQKLSGF